MSKNYQRGKFNNKARQKYNWQINKKTLLNQSFVSTLIVRGIGYRAFALQNDLLNSSQQISQDFLITTRPIYSAGELPESEIVNRTTELEFGFDRYLSVRAGHTRDLYLPLTNDIRCLTSKKDRKLAILSKNLSAATNLARKIYLYRSPSVYTGRGVRSKHVNPLRKAGKKDKQKGKAF